MLKVLIPSMPTADDLLPYLRRMDASRVYVNCGPLYHELVERLGGMFHASIAPVSNGTLALELALRALDLPPRSEVLVPAVTFKGSGQAIVNAGHVPVLSDVSPHTWQLEAADARRILRARPSIRCVMPVAAFGLAVPAGEWASFGADTGAHVLIDAAGAIMQQQVPDCPSVTVAFSLHATKAVGAGEGGFVASTDAKFVARVADLAAFGRDGTNAKMSEYHAAVALASLHPMRLAQKAHHCANLTFAYARLPYLRQAGYQTHRTLYPVLLPDGLSPFDVGAELARAGIETRRWYAPFLHELPEFRGYRRDALPITARLSRRMLGLPFHDFMTAEDVERVIAALAALERATA